MQGVKETAGYALAGGVVSAVTGTVLPVGGQTVGHVVGEVARRGMAHKVTPMVKHFRGEKEQKQAGINDILVSLNTERSRTAMRTHDSIQINIK